LYANSLTQEDVERLRASGCVSTDPYPLLNPGRYANDQLRLGAKVYRFQCSVCHTVWGVNGLTGLTGSWTLDQKRMNIAKLQHTKPFMPPFAGPAEEVEAVVQMLSWVKAGRPNAWAVSNEPDTISRIQEWLNEVGTTPAGSSP
jgi:mono/diheme cytochrome c family protein